MWRMKCLLLFAMLGVGILRTESCSEPLGYETLSKTEVLKNQNLVIMGTFKKQDNTEEDVNGYKRYVLRLDTEVDCILRNTNNVTIGKNIKISEWRAGGFDMVSGCTDYFCCIRMGAEAIISLSPNEDFPNEFQFKEYNLQGHTYYTDIADLRDGKWMSVFPQTPTITPGGQCPVPVTLDQNSSNNVSRSTAKLWVFAVLVLPLFNLIA